MNMHDTVSSKHHKQFPDPYGFPMIARIKGLEIEY